MARGGDGRGNPEKRSLPLDFSRLPPPPPDFSDKANGRNEDEDEDEDKGAVEWGKGRGDASSGSDEEKFSEEDDEYAGNDRRGSYKPAGHRRERGPSEVERKAFESGPTQPGTGLCSDGRATGRGGLSFWENILVTVGVPARTTVGAYLPSRCTL